MITYTHEISTEEYAMLRASAGWRALSARQAEAALNSSTFLVAARDGARAVGMARLMGDGGYFAVVLDVVVLPEYQGRGIGREMMTRAVRHIQSGLRPGEHSYTILTCAPGKEGFYEKMGFYRVPNEDEGAGLVMRMAGK
ncbi:MAG: GNAT family N-acetyltransferase [Oscillospiraceae bacterium]|nr:GNAT family N-acetyltransferase [Oscillospiraceae bacterium]